MHTVNGMRAQRNKGYRNPRKSVNINPRINLPRRAANSTTPLNKNDVWALSGTEIETVLRYGNDMSGLKKIADHYGYKSEYANNIDIPKLEYLLSIGAMPILNIKQNDNGSGGGSHAVLAIGYSKSDQTIYINDPAMQLSAFDYKRLERRWSANLSSPPGSSYQSAFIIYPSKQ
jgi:hypothetical protein